MNALDWNKLSGLLLDAALGILTLYLPFLLHAGLNLLKEKLVKSRMLGHHEFQSVIEDLVIGAEQALGAGQGSAKRALVIDLAVKYFAQRGITADPGVIGGFLEANVVQLKKDQAEANG